MLFRSPHRAQGPLLRVSAQESTRGLFVRPVEPVSSNPAAVPRAVLQTSPRPRSPMRLVIPGVVALLTLTGVLGVWYFTREPATTPTATATVAQPRVARPTTPTPSPTPAAQPAPTPNTPSVAPTPPQTPTVAQVAPTQPEAQPEAQAVGRHGSRRGRDRHSRQGPDTTTATTNGSSTTTTAATPPATPPTQGTAVANTPTTQSGSTTLHGGTQEY